MLAINPVIDLNILTSGFLRQLQKQFGDVKQIAPQLYLSPMCASFVSADVSGNTRTWITAGDAWSHCTASPPPSVAMSTLGNDWHTHHHDSVTLLISLSFHYSFCPSPKSLSSYCCCFPFPRCWPRQLIATQKAVISIFLYFKDSSKVQPEQLNSLFY